MKRLVPLGLLLAVVAGVSIISSPGAANGQSAGLVSSVLNRMERNRQSLKSLKASLSMEKYNSQLRDKDQYIGSVMYMPANGRNAYVRIEWQKPRREILAVANGQYTLFRPSLNQAMRGKTGSIKGSQGAGSVLDMIQNAAAIIHLNCGTAIEAVLLGAYLWLALMAAREQPA